MIKDLLKGKFQKMIIKKIIKKIFKGDEMKFDKIDEIFTTATDQDIIDFVDVWIENAKDFGITTKHHEDMLLATILAEVGTNLKSVRENLNYTPNSLRATFSRYRNNPNWSERDGRTSGHEANQVNIGNIAYADRLGNGNISSGDGYRFRGGSFIQTTGRYNWEKTAKIISMLGGTHIGAENLEEECHTVTVGLLMTFAFFYDNDIGVCETMNCCTDKVNYHTSSRQRRNESYNTISKI